MIVPTPRGVLHVSYNCRTPMRITLTQHSATHLILEVFVLHRFYMVLIWLGLAVQFSLAVSVDSFEQS